MIKPYFETELGKLYHGDCLEIMRQLNDIDIIITDPPYGVGKNMENDNISDEILIEKWKKWGKGFYKILKENGNLLIEVPKNKKQYWNVFEYFNFEYPLILRTSNAIRQCKVGFNDYSLCLWFGKTKGILYKRYKDCITTYFINSAKPFKHPSPKNINHYKRLLNMFSLEKQIICDPFLGSGTLAIACEQLNRRWIGIEISKEYCDIAVDRIKKETAQYKMDLV